MHLVSRYSCPPPPPLHFVFLMYLKGVDVENFARGLCFGSCLLICLASNYTKSNQMFCIKLPPEVCSGPRNNRSNLSRLQPGRRIRIPSNLHGLVGLVKYYFNLTVCKTIYDVILSQLLCMITQPIYLNG